MKYSSIISLCWNIEQCGYSRVKLKLWEDEGKVEKEEDEEAEEEEGEDEGKVKVNAETYRDLHISHEALKSCSVLMHISSRLWLKNVVQYLKLK